MSSELIPLSQLFQNKLFRIPDYQRGYAWQEQQLVDFWDDVINLQDDRYHYTGLLSLKALSGKETANWGNDLWMVEKGYKPCHIVDGQQRLTTFVILISELVRFVRNMDENKDKKDGEIVLGYDTLTDITSKYICQKRPPHNLITTYLFGYESDNPSDKFLRHKVFGEPFSGEISETYYTKNLLNAKKFFAESVAELYAQEGFEGIEALYKKLTQRMKFNLHEIDDDYDVYVAFETMNNRGKHLTNLELLKNRLIYLTTIYSDKEFDEKEKAGLRDEINEAWKEIYFQLGRNVANSLSDDEFLRAHWIIYYTYSRQKGDDYIRFLLDKFSAKNVFEKKTSLKVSDGVETISDLDVENEDDEDANADDYTEASFGKLPPKDISDYVNSMKDLAKYWYESFFPYESRSLTDDEKLWIDRLNRIGIGYFRPLVAVVLSIDCTSLERVELFKAIERFIFLFFRMAVYRSTYQTSVYHGAAREIYRGGMTVKEVTDKINDTCDSNIGYIVPAFINDIEKKFKSGTCEGYYGWNSLRYFMYEYEYSLMEKTGIKRITREFFSKSEKDKVSIEHILPQTPSKWYWQNQFRQFVGNRQEIAALTGSLGNLLPLSQSINSSLQNDSFEEKKNPSSNSRRGYTSGSNSEIEVSKKSDWNADTIHQRTMLLLDFMMHRWNIPFTAEQKSTLAFDGFIFDGREIPDEIPEKTFVEEPVAVKADIHEVRPKFWAYALPKIKEAQGGQGHPYSGVEASDIGYKDGFFGTAGVHLFCNTTTRKPLFCNTGLWIDTGKRETNKGLFDMLLSHKEDIEKKASRPVVWDRKDAKAAASIEFVLENADVTDSLQWEEIADFFAKMSKETADFIFYPYEQEIREYLAKTKQ